MAITRRGRVPPWLESSRPHIYGLSKANQTGRSAIIKTAPNHTIHALCQCTHDLLTGKIPLSTAHCRKLKPHKAKILKLLKPGASVEQRRKVLQSGGFIGTLTAALVSAIPALISIFKK